VVGPGRASDRLVAPHPPTAHRAKRRNDDFLLMMEGTLLVRTLTGR
jgi:hypothetical protein